VILTRSQSRFIQIAQIAVIYTNVHFATVECPLCECLIYTNVPFANVRFVLPEIYECPLCSLKMSPFQSPGRAGRLVDWVGIPAAIPGDSPIQLAVPEPGVRSGIDSELQILAFRE
jgi:hypothetical protein